MSVFHGKWICPQEFKELHTLNIFHREGEPSPEALSQPSDLKNLHIHFLARLNLSELPQSAMLRVSADDYYKLRINGLPACQGPAPAYHFRYGWNEVDISSYICIGENFFDFEVYYQGLINRVWCSGDLRCGLICDVIVDGKPLLVSGGEFEYYISRRWKGDRVFGYDTQFAEEYDATITEPSPLPVWVNESADYIFDDKPSEVLETYEVSPEKLEYITDGSVFCDFGAEITGTLNITCEGDNGERIDIFCGEESDSSTPRVKCPTRCGCDYHDIFIISEEKVFRGYDYKAFRYVSIVPTGGARVVSVTATVRHASFKERMKLGTDDETLRAVYDICRRGVMLGSQEVFVDCPSREKGQYSGDLIVTAASRFWLTGDTKMLKRAIRSLMDSAFIDKGLMSVAPCSHMQEIADYSLFFPLIAGMLYDFSGDADFLRECLSTCESVISYFGQFADASGLLRNAPKWNLVDWPENLRDGYEFAPIHNVINAWYLCAVSETERIKKILGISYDGKFLKLCDAFNSAFFRPDIGLYVDNPESSHASLHANVLPLFSGIVPKENIPRIADFIEKKGLCCGTYFAYFMLKALCRAGRYEAAYQLIVSKNENSWYNMVREGGTACFEAWGKEQKWNTSLCHPWSSGPIPVLAEICGLKAKAGRIILGESFAPNGTGLTLTKPLLY